MGIYYHPPHPHTGASQPGDNRKLVQGAAVVTGDNPPFAMTNLINMLDNVITAWQPGPPLPQRLENFIVQGTIVAADNPPFGRKDWFSAVVDHWNPAPLKPMWGGVIVVDNPTVVNDPPFGQRLWLENVLLAWDAVQPKPLPTLPRSIVQPTTATNDNPPFGNPAMRILMDIIRAWQPEVYDPLRYKSNQIVVQPFFSVDNPPPGGTIAQRQILANILAAWQPGPPAPQRFVPKQAVNNPPPVLSAYVKIRKGWFRNG